MDTIKSKIQEFKDKANSFMTPSSNIKTTISNNISKANNIANNSITNQSPTKSNNFTIVVGIFIAFILFLVLYFLSKTYRVSLALDTHNIYQKYTTISSIPYEKEQIAKLRLADVSVASSYNSCLVGYQMLDYVSLEVLEKTIQSGARFVEFQIFNSEYGEASVPIVSNGYKDGEWKMTVDKVFFEDCAKVIEEHAFQIGDGENGVPNPDDPLFISLNLKTNHNLYCLDMLSDIIVDYFRDRLLSNKYSYQQNEIADITMEELKGRVIILSSEGFEGSKLDEVVNYSWGMKGMRRMHYSELENADSRQIQAYNKRGITLVEPHKEGDFWTQNFNPQRAYDLGCQFVLMNWQHVDENMDKYITKFRRNSIVAKPKKLRRDDKKQSKD